MASPTPSADVDMASLPPPAQNVEMASLPPVAQILPLPHVQDLATVPVIDGFPAEDPPAAQLLPANVLQEIGADGTENAAGQQPQPQPEPEPEAPYYQFAGDTPELAYLHELWFGIRPMYRQEVKNNHFGNCLVSENCVHCGLTHGYRLPQHVPFMQEPACAKLVEVIRAQIRPIHRNCRNPACLQIQTLHQACSDGPATPFITFDCLRLYSLHRQLAKSQFKAALSMRACLAKRQHVEQQIEFQEYYQDFKRFPSRPQSGLLHIHDIQRTGIAKVSYNANIRPAETVPESFTCKVCYRSCPKFWVVYMQCR